MHLDIEMFENTLLDGVKEADREYTEKHRARKSKIFNDKEINSVSPSSASIVMRNEKGFRDLIGSCSREVWFRVTGILPSNPTDFISKYKMSMGKDIESTEQEYIEKGIRVNQSIDQSKSGFFKNVLFYFEDAMYGINILGEMDGLIIINGRPHPLEIKSIYGYYSIRNVFGNKTLVGKPKENHFLQASLYVYALQHPEKLRLWTTNGDEATEITGLITEPCTHGFMRYVNRSDATTKTFMLSLQKVLGTSEENYTPLVDGEIYLNITLKDIFKRYHSSMEKIIEFKEYREGKRPDFTVPPRDSIYQYSPERLAWLRNQTDTALMSKSEREEYDKKGTLTKGEWQCRYCSYRDCCLGTTPWEQNYPPDEEIKAFIIQYLKENKNE